ncbi:MAG: hypothetical protein K0U78_16715 [Actinomycetia bacterium]|nr:hypothetical protein [Actinomycetes bacterium]
MRDKISAAHRDVHVQVLDEVGDVSADPAEGSRLLRRSNTCKAWRNSSPGSAAWWLSAPAAKPERFSGYETACTHPSLAWS